MGLFGIIIVLHLISYALAASFLPNLKPFHFDRIDGMAHGLKIPIRVSYTIVKQEKNVLYLNSTINVEEDMNEEALSSTKIFRCASKEQLDTCELFLTTQPQDFCKGLDPKLSKFNPFYIKYVPEYKCPVAKGTYRAHNWKLDFTQYVVLPFGNSYWKSVTEFRNPKTNRIIQIMKIDGYQPK